MLGATKVRWAIGFASLVVAISAMAAPERAAAEFYWGGGSLIGRANLNGLDADPSFISGAALPCGLAVDAGHIYWGEGGGNIARANLDGSSVDPSFITTSSGAPCGVAVDATHIYWANNFGGAIGRANIDGSSPDPSFITGANGPWGVAIDSSHVYWANDGGNSIGRANLDGTSPQQHFLDALGPKGVAVDGSYVYWANTGGTTESIARATIAGTAPNQSFIPGLTSPCAVAVDAGHIYWGEYGSVVGRANIDGSSPDSSFVAPGAGLDCGVAIDSLHGTTTALSCAPAKFATGGATSCTATVTDTEDSPATPTGSVAFTTSGAGAFSPSSSCTLTSSGPGQASCKLTYTTSAVSKPLITAAYAGDSGHVSSKDATTVAVSPSNIFNIRLRKFLLRIPADLVVRVPGAGELRLFGRGLKTVSLHVGAGGGKAGLPLKAKLPLRVKGAKRRHLRRKGRVSVRPHVTYTPTGGTPNTKTVKVTLVKRRRH